MAKVSFAGVVNPAKPQDLLEPQQTTVNIVVQGAAYTQSDIVFAFGDDIPLDALSQWYEQEATNSKGAVTRIVLQQTSAGAASSLLGYARNSSEIIGVVASSASFALMAPVLRNSNIENVLFYIAGLSYDYKSGQLVSDDNLGYEVARDLGFKTFVTSNSGAVAQATAFTAAEYLKDTKKPTVLLYDGVRGVLSSSFEQLGTANKTVENFSYRGPKEPESVVVALASAPVSTQAIYNVIVPGNLHKLPTTAADIFVYGDALYQDTAASIRLERGIKFAPRVSKYEFRPETAVPLLLWDGDRNFGSQTTEPFVRAANYIGKPYHIYETLDSTIDAGSVEYAFDSAAEPTVGAKTNALIVNKSSVLRHASLKKLVAKGTLIIAGSTDDINKLPEQQKREIANGGYKVYALDYNLLDSEATEGRTKLFALQALIWQTLDPEASIDDLSSRIIHSNSQDMELLGSTIAKLIENLRAKALIQVDTKEWADVEVDQTKLISLREFAATSFSPADPIDPVVETDIVAMSKTEIAKRITFSESYDEKEDLRPEVSSKNFISKVLINQRVTPDDYDRHIFHLELDITGTGLTYAIGEALGIHAPNNVEKVREFIEWYGLDPNQVVAVPHRDDPSILESKTIFQTLRDNLDIFGKVPKRFYEELAAINTDKEEKTRLQKLCGPAGTAELKQRSEEELENYVDVLREFTNSRPSFEKLVEIVAPLKRREYSIASSQKIHPNAVHLLIVVVDWKDKYGNTRYGQCSKFLADLHPGQEVTVSVKTSVMKLPKDPKAPVIMAGLGTGLAPFKAFLEEKLWQKQQGLDIGPVYLFLGSRHQRQEYLYGELFEAYKAAGVLTHIGAAFSRDQKEKIYIQHRIKQAKEQLIDAFVKQSGNFYLCGPTWPVPDISEALYDIVSTEAATRGESVDEETLIEELKDKERYILEVY